MLSEPELDALAKDIAAHGLREKIVLRRKGDQPDGARCLLLDGRNRFLALQRLGWDIEPHTVVVSASDVPDQVAYVISRNILRRHLTKEQQADLIVKAITAMTDSATLAPWVPRDHSRARSGLYERSGACSGGRGRCEARHQQADDTAGPRESEDGARARAAGPRQGEERARAYKARAQGDRDGPGVFAPH